MVFSLISFSKVRNTGSSYSNLSPNNTEQMTLDTALLSIIFVSNGFPVYQAVKTNDDVIMVILVWFPMEM